MKPPVNVLPADLAPVEHMMEPSSNWPWIVAAALAAWFLRAWWLRRRPAPVFSPAPTLQTEPPVPSLHGIAGEIEALRARYHDDYRRGCHELAELLREHSERSSTRDFNVLTAREIARTLGETALARVFLLLSDLQFGRKEPDASDFHGICDIAQETLGKAGESPAEKAE